MWQFGLKSFDAGLQKITKLQMFAGLPMIISLAVCLLMITGKPVAAGAELTINPVERIVFLGNTFMERENEYGQLELLFRLAFPGQELHFRNLGWAGDNVLGESRAYFGPVSAGYAHLQEYIQLTNPTLLLISYGHNAAFENSDQHLAFLQGYEKLLQDVSAPERRVVVLGITPLEAVHRDPDTTDTLNQKRKDLNGQIQQLCEKKGIAFINLFTPLKEVSCQQAATPLTDNGVHFNRTGYLYVGETICRAFGKDVSEYRRLLLENSAFQAAVTPLEQKIERKNELFFHRFRPQNETYLRGFRKHEQGQNAKEIYQFDPLVEAAEQELQPLAGKLLSSWNGE